MRKNTIYLISAIGLIAVAIAVYFIAFKSFDYKVLDEIKNESESGNMTFLFIDVSKLDSNNILDAAHELLQERIIDKYKDFKPHDGMDPEMAAPDVLVAYFYKQDDTTQVPEAMQNVLKSKFPDNDIIRLKLNLISEGFMYTGAYNPYSKIITMDSLSGRTMLFVPQAGTRAKDIMDQTMPPGHPDMNQMPEGHPDMNQMPEGHPDMNQMPPGHPDINQMPKGHPDMNQMKPKEPKNNLQKKM